MATSSPQIALAALAAFGEAIPTMALIHGANMLSAGGPLSDLDLAASDLSPDWINQLVGALHQHDLRILIAWPYDSAAVSLFLAAQGLQEGVQVDLLHSPDGHGKYGFRTSVALPDAIDGRFGRELAPIDSWLYQVRKRSLKGQDARLKALLNRPPASQREIAVRAGEVFSAGHRDVVRAVLNGKTPTEPAAPRHAELRRLAFRLLHPAGLWIHLDGVGAQEQAVELCRRCSRFVVRAEIEPDRFDPRSVNTHIRTRWRAGVLITLGPGGRWSNIRVDRTDVADAVFETVRQEASVRAESQLRLLHRKTIL